MSETKTPTPTGTEQERLPVCTVEGEARALPPCAHCKGTGRIQISGLNPDDCGACGGSGIYLRTEPDGDTVHMPCPDCKHRRNTLCKTVYTPESGAIGANPGNVPPDPKSAPRIENSGQAQTERAGGVDTRPEIKPCGVCVGMGKIYYPNEPVPHCEPCHVCKGKAFFVIPPESPQETLSGWLIRDDRKKPLMVLPCKREETAWESLGTAWEVSTADLKATGATARPVFILPAPTDPMQPEPADIKPEAAGLLLAALSEQTRAAGEVVELRERVKQLQAAIEAKDTKIESLRRVLERCGLDSKWACFNVNHYVRVRLTDHGRKLIDQSRDTTAMRIASEADEKGRSKWQMHHLMNLLGPHIRLGAELPFETDIDIEVVREEYGERTQ